MPRKKSKTHSRSSTSRKAVPAAKETRTVWVSAGIQGRLLALLSQDQPMALVALKDVLQMFVANFSDGARAYVNVVNWLTGPYVDASLILPGNQVVALPSRKQLEGEYRFPVGETHYLVEVRFRRGEPCDSASSQMDRVALRKNASKKSKTVRRRK